MTDSTEMDAGSNPAFASFNDSMTFISPIGNKKPAQGGLWSFSSTTFSATQKQKNFPAYLLFYF